MRGILGEIKVCRIFGIEIFLDWSWFLIFFLVSWQFIAIYTIYFNNEYLGAITGFLTTILFFFSIVWHEMAHSLVGRRYGFSVEKITLLFFGGMAHLEKGDLSKAKSEFFMSIAGPLSSFALGLIFFVFTSLFKIIDLHIFSRIGFLISRWLVEINIILGAFNLIPCLPMDGGRVFRAILNFKLKDFLKATKISFAVSQSITWSVVFLGIISIIFGYPIFGKLTSWFIFLALFINIVSRQDYSQTLFRYILTFIKVREIMVPLNMPVKASPDQLFLSPDETAMEAFEKMSKNGCYLLFVMENNEFIGRVSYREILKRFAIEKIKIRRK